MRSIFRGALLALVATLALGAVASASASAALPEVTIVAGGAYPLNLESSQTTATAKISGVVEAHNCIGVNTKGSIAARGKTVALTLELDGCELPKGTKCSTTEAGAGIEAFTGNGTLVYINKAKKEAGILFALNATEILCGSIKEKIKGSILMPVTPINTQAKELGLIATGNGSGSPTYTKYENEKGESATAKLELSTGGAYKEVALEIGAEVKPVVQGGKQLEIQASRPPENTELPVVSPATPVQGKPESTTKGAWSNAPTSYAYQWYRCNASGGECKEIVAANISEYTPGAEDVGHTLVAKVTATNEFGPTSASSLATNKVEAVTTSGLPEFVLGEGGTFPVTLTYSNSAAWAYILNPVETISCEGIASKGSITGAKIVSVTIELKKCHTAKSTECQTAAGAPGVIVLPASGSPVYIKKAEKLAGTLLTLGGTQFTCGTVTVKVRGSMVDPITPVNTKTSVLDLSVQGNGKGQPTYSTYENEKSEAVKVKLETNFGTTYKESALEAVSEWVALGTSEALTFSA